MSACRRELIQHFHTVALFDLSLTLTSINYKTFTYMVHTFFHPLRSVKAKFAFAAVVSSVSVADSTKGTHVKFDLTLT